MGTSSNSDIVISVKNVRKSFKVYYDKGTSLKEKTLFKKRNRYEEHQVLKGISFDVKRGEAVGLIGQNGCGKSTTLKLLTKIMYPNSGSIEVKGRASALIELGAGFHPDMSGRENIYINAAIFGLSRAEIDERVDSIIEFSELGEYIDNPVRTYSSGMYMRLAFAVAISVDAEVLFVDEILAVGDTAFQAKCFNKLREIKAAGTTIVIVSHSLGQIEQICDRSIWIRDGEIYMDDNPRIVDPAYLEYMGNKVNKGADQSTQTTERASETQEEKTAAQEQPLQEEKTKSSKDRWGSGEARIQSIQLLDENRQEKTAFQTGKKMEIVVHYTTKRELKNAICGIGIFRNDGVNCYGTNTHIDRIKNVELSGGKFVCAITNNQLIPGEYTLDVAIHDENGLVYDYYRFAQKFTMYSSLEDIGVARLEHEWIL